MSEEHPGPGSVDTAARPRARSQDIIVARVDDEVVVYDLKTLRAHALNRSASLVWSLCDGTRTPEELSLALAAQLGVPPESDAVGLALDRFARAELLAEPIATAQPRPSRRAVLTTAGKLGIAAALVPAITTLAAPPAASALSCKPDGQPCLISTECCSAFCDVVCMSSGE